ncbi:hypothetical protein CEXT_110861 [Caerostris extrusa]|uniref:Uncharacterized protein n=1 Tax=Caerostris extrusa TaxID=172846 RepID=A0AAV4WAD1_CAEEX|nr:hypothetical protein CEXT_110861 [Caerostris extrusa]
MRSVQLPVCCEYHFLLHEHCPNPSHTEHSYPQSANIGIGISGRNRFFKWKRPLILMFVGHFCWTRTIPLAALACCNCIQITARDIVSDKMNYYFLYRGLGNNAFIGCQSSEPLFAQL